jgi:hypothetical protein
VEHGDLRNGPLERDIRIGCFEVIVIVP